MKENFDELISRFLNSEVTSEEIEQLDKWLAEDEGHVRYFFRCKNLYDVNHPAFSPVAIDERRAYRRIHSRQKEKRVWLWKSIAAAVVLFGCLVSGVMFYSPRKNSSTMQTANFQRIPSAMLTLPTGEKIRLDGQGTQEIVNNRIAVAHVEKNAIKYAARDTVTNEFIYHVLSVPRGGEFFLTLSDNTKIWVNADTKIRFPVKFSGQERRIYVEGEAYLEVAHDTAFPFVVVMPRNKITVLGTSFDVKAYPEEKNDRITLVSGKVKVDSDKDDQEVVLIPGEQAVIDRKGGKIMKYVVDTDIYCNWREGKVVFKNNSLEEILTTLARWYDLRICWQDESLKNIFFSGEMKKYDDIEKLLEMISHTGDVKFVVHHRDIIVNKP